jgi:phospholipase/carboxylesterase
MKPALVIALHGLGADGSDLMPLQQMMGLTDVPWLFPDAPSLPVTVNGGMSMPAWFDILGFSPDDPVDGAGIRASAQRLQQMIAEQVAQGVEAQRILLLGFSQGGVVVLHAALSFGFRVGAVIGLSTWLPAFEQLSPVSPSLTETPIWLGHGRFDTVVPLQAHERAKQRLSTLGMTQVSSALYPMAHTIVPEELMEASAWLARL